jgi:hypothetical protein
MVRDEAADFEHPDIPAGHPLRPHVLYRMDARAYARNALDELCKRFASMIGHSSVGKKAAKARAHLKAS